MEEDIKKLLEENLALTKNLQQSMVQIQRYLRWQRAFSAMYFVLVVAPIIFALIYLPPLIGPFIDQYQQLFQDYSSMRSNSGPIINPEFSRQLLDTLGR